MHSNNVFTMKTFQQQFRDNYAKTKNNKLYIKKIPKWLLTQSLKNSVSNRTVLLVYLSPKTVKYCEAPISAEPAPAIQREAFINAPRSPISESVSTVKISGFEFPCLTHCILYEIKLKIIIVFSLNFPGIKSVKM